jgi:hypothetical protein
MSCQVRIEYPTTHTRAKLRQTACYLEVDKALEISTACKTLFLLHVSHRSTRKVGRINYAKCDGSCICLSHPTPPPLAFHPTSPSASKRITLDNPYPNVNANAKARWRKGKEERERRGEDEARYTMYEPKPCGSLLSASQWRHCNMCNTRSNFEQNCY